MFIADMKSGDTVSPRLLEVLERVHAKRPLLEFANMRTNFDGEVVMVSVWQQGQQIGTINSHFRRYSPSRQADEILYAVSSHSIKLERKRDKDTKTTKNSKSAALIALTAFVLKDVEEVAHQTVVQVTSDFNAAHQNMYRRYVESIPFNPVVSNDYFVDLYLGKNPSPPYMSAIATNDSARKKENYEIATNVVKHWETGNVCVVREMRDGSLLVSDRKCTDVKQHESFAALPTFLEEKFAMLKLLDPQQFARDIGIKFQYTNHTVYVIVNGATVVV